MSVEKDLEFYLEVASEVYKENPVVPNVDFHKHLEGSVSGTDAFVGIHESEQFLIAFRGTDDIKAAITDLRFGKKKIPYENVKSKIRVHNGFIDAYKEIRGDIHDLYQKNPKNIVLITGHSLGGALATLCAVDMQYNFQNEETTNMITTLQCITFGSPRVGNGAFTNSYNRRVPRTFRVVNRDDIITRIPYWFMGFRHVKQKIQLGKRHWWRFLFGKWGKDHHQDEYRKGLTHYLKKK
jgi:predicted lipase